MCMPITPAEAFQWIMAIAALASFVGLGYCVYQLLTHDKHQPSMLELDIMNKHNCTRREARQILRR